MRVLFINNKDSFVYILVDYVAQQRHQVTVVDNMISPHRVAEMKPDKIIISPGPGHPRRSTGTTLSILRRFRRIPTLGVCLGHQAIVEAFGGSVALAKVGPVHGKASLIYHDEKGVFQGLPNPFKATRYHSLAALPDSIPSCLEVTAKSEDMTIMGVRHRHYPVEGVQFHPESILTEEGIRLIRNFLEA